MDDPETGEREEPPLVIGPENWPEVAADKVVAVVGAIRSHTTDNVVRAARAAVYGLVALVAAVALLVLLTIIAVRLADAYLPVGAGVGSATWAAHAFIGALVSILGLGVWRARTSTARPVWVAVIVDAALIVAVVFYGVIGAVA